MDMLPDISRLPIQEQQYRIARHYCGVIANRQRKHWRKECKYCFCTRRKCGHCSEMDSMIYELKKLFQAEARERNAANTQLGTDITNTHKESHNGN